MKIFQEQLCFMLPIPQSNHLIDFQNITCLKKNIKNYDIAAFSDFWVRFVNLLKIKASIK